MRICLLALSLLWVPLIISKTLDKVVGVVQGKAILLSDVRSLKTQVQSSPLLRNFYHIEGTIDDKAMLTRLVEDQIVAARLKELGAEINNDQVSKEVEDIARKNKISVAQLKNVLKSQGVDFENYFDALKSNIERRSLYRREIQTTGSTMTDEELKGLYAAKSPPEFKLAMLLETASPKNKQLLEDIKKQFIAGKIPPDKLKEHPDYVDLGWITADQVAEEFQKQMGTTAKAGSAYGPLKKSGKLQLLLVENVRRGSDAQFAQVKDRFKDSLEDQEGDQKFKLWIEKKKNDLEVSVNPI